MRSRLVPLVGGAAGLLLAVLVVVGVGVDRPVLSAAAGATLGAAILAVQVDSWRRIRSMRNFLRDEIRRSTDRDGYAVSGLAAAPIAQDDLLGAVRVLQATYTGRLDRMQRTLDDALDELAARSRDDR